LNVRLGVRLGEKGILFDFDGVVLKSMEQHFEAWRNAFQEKNIGITPDDFYILEGQGIKRVAYLLGERYGLDETVINDVMNRKVHYYEKFMTIEFYDYFEIMLNSFKKNEIPMGVVTGGSRERVNKIINEYMDNYFDCVVTVDDVERGKPFPDPFLKGAELLDYKPEDCLVIENAPMGIEGAVKAGMTVIAITTTLDSEYLKQANYIADNFREVEEIVLSIIKFKTEQ